MSYKGFPFLFVFLLVKLLQVLIIISFKNSLSSISFIKYIGFYIILLNKQSIYLIAFLNNSFISSVSAKSKAVSPVSAPSIFLDAFIFAPLSIKNLAIS